MADRVKRLSGQSADLPLDIMRRDFIGATLVGFGSSLANERNTLGYRLGPITQLIPCIRLPVERVISTEITNPVNLAVSLAQIIAGPRNASGIFVCAFGYLSDTPLARCISQAPTSPHRHPPNSASSSSPPRGTLAPGSSTLHIHLLTL